MELICVFYTNVEGLQNKYFLNKKVEKFAKKLKRSKCCFEGQPIFTVIIIYFRSYIRSEYCEVCLFTFKITFFIVVMPNFMLSKPRNVYRSNQHC